MRSKDKVKTCSNGGSIIYGLDFFFFQICVGRQQDGNLYARDIYVSLDEGSVYTVRGFGGYNVPVI